MIDFITLIFMQNSGINLNVQDGFFILLVFMGSRCSTTELMTFRKS